MNEPNEVNEVNFDGIVGPSYNFQALATGNLASMGSLGKTSNPRSAALEGLAKAETVMSLGVRQALIPPLMRPNLGILYRIGLIKDKGLLRADDTAALAHHLTLAAKASPELLAAAYSGSSVWTANSATVSTSADTEDGRIHLTPANMTSLFHRSLEGEAVRDILKQIFCDDAHFVVHDPLPRSHAFGDEGAANHFRLAKSHSAKGLDVFVYGRDGIDDYEPGLRYFSRQTRLASEAVARVHGLDPDRTVFLKQNPRAIDAGAFHNDVVAASNIDVLFYHQHAFDRPSRAIAELNERYHALEGTYLRTIEVPYADITLEEAVTSYLFNSQIVIDRNGRALLIAPRECEQIPRVRNYLERLVKQDDKPAEAVIFVNTSGSMESGGGPACLRLRVPLTETQQIAMGGRVLLTPEILTQLRDIVNHEYPTQVTSAMFADKTFIETCFSATRHIYEVLGLTPAQPGD